MRAGRDSYVALEINLELTQIMELITDSKDLESKFLSLLEKYSNYFFSTAWAGLGSRVEKSLWEKRSRIKKAIIGTHFYQTHPNFIEKYMNLKSVRFIYQPNGTYHPKCYLFFNNDSDWALLIGSSNFTEAAFSKNTEVNLLVRSKIIKGNHLRIKFENFIQNTWNDSSNFSLQDLYDYRAAWRLKHPFINSLSNETPISLASMATSGQKMTWEAYISQLRSHSKDELDRRLSAIQLAQKLMKKSEHFHQIAEDDRKFIAGLPNQSVYSVANADWGYFGSMKPSLKFKKQIRLNNNLISSALDFIPHIGPVTHDHFVRFTELFRRVCGNESISSASRLLAMKRPDVFFCITNKNRDDMFADFGIKKGKMNYNRYWSDVILEIQKSAWWNSKPGSSQFEKDIFNARVAFLDALYYVE